MKKLFKALLLLFVVSLVAAAVAAYVSRQRLAAMSDDEIRSYLASKIGEKVDEEQLVAIQDAVISGVRKSGTDTVVDLVEEAAETVETSEDE